jgi:hypothetical protein
VNSSLSQADGSTFWVDPIELRSRKDTIRLAAGGGAWHENVWQTQSMRTALGEIGEYHHMLAWAEQRDWWFYQPTGAERRLFSVWFARAIGTREYDNPLIADLYLLHDLMHAYTFIDAPDDSNARWRLRMRANEIRVSLETEVLIYARCPWLRKLSFPFEVWGDRFLRRGGVDGGPNEWGVAMTEREQLLLDAASVWPLDTPAGWSGLWWARRKASLRPDPADQLEVEIQQYGQMATVDYDAWGEWWRDVERFRISEAEPLQTRT